MRTFVIAEAGISHDGSMKKAIMLIEAAKQAGASAVKFQTFNAGKLAARRKDASLRDKLARYQMPLSWLEVLKGECENIGIEFMTTCFDEETLEIVAPLVNRFKVGHGESGDRSFLEAHQKYGKPIIASYFNDCVHRDFVSEPIYVTTKYPTPIKDLHLENMKAFNLLGFSDHVCDPTGGVGGYAVAMGAKIIEAHFCVDETESSNPDRMVSYSQDSFEFYVDEIRDVELAIYGEGSEEATPAIPPGYAQRISHPQVEAGFVHPGDPQAESFVSPSPGLPLPEKKNSQQGGPRA